jgi:hypothetical protein
MVVSAAHLASVGVTAFSGFLLRQEKVNERSFKLYRASGHRARRETVKWGGMRANPDRGLQCVLKVGRSQTAAQTAAQSVTADLPRQNIDDVAEYRFNDGKSIAQSMSMHRDFPEPRQRGPGARRGGTRQDSAASHRR